jgi:nicotinate-nucleotide adenylyltransferase
MRRVQSGKRVGLMGGTFDPIHFGHLFLAEEARVHCELDEVVFFPNRQPAHYYGKTAGADVEARYHMTRLAIEGNAHFRVSRVEVEREGPSYAIDTVQQFQEELGKDTELFFLAGADAMQEVTTWHRAPELLAMCRFIGVSRPGYDLESAARVLAPLQKARVTWLQVPGLHISSSELRRRVREGLPIRYLVPDAVERAIAESDLYRERNSK